MKYLTSAVYLLLLITTSCQVETSNMRHNATPTISSALVPTTEAAPTSSLPPDMLSFDGGTPAPQPTETPVPDTPKVVEPQFPLGLRLRYTITATLDYGWRYLTVEQEIVIPNTSTEPFSDVILVVQPNWQPGVFNLTQLTWENGESVSGYTLDGIRLRVPLVDPLEPGENLQLSLVYNLSIPPILTSENFGPNPFGYTSRQTNLTDWYPFVPPYIDGQGWLVHNPWYYGEHLVYPVADFNVTIQVTNAPSGMVVAASGLDTGTGDVHHYRLEQARNFVWSVSPEYQVLREQIGKTTVLGYAFPFDIVPGEAAFTTTVRALELYNELFGPYPFDSLTLIQADFEQGMEYSGLYFLSKAFYNTYDGTSSTYLVAIAAHETAHQWWYGLVGNDQALEPWLDEAMCTYSEKLFFEKIYPQSLEWWEYTRIDYYEPTGWVDNSIYTTTGYRPYRDAVYLNGARFLSDLRTLVGDEVFFAFLRDYVTQESYKLVTADQFFAILREHSDADWNGLLDGFFENR
jgi:hypothetical protein